jgi:hypothetical protein
MRQSNDNQMLQITYPQFEAVELRVKFPPQVWGGWSEGPGGVAQISNTTRHIHYLGSPPVQIGAGELATGPD